MEHWRTRLLQQRRVNGAMRRDQHACFGRVELSGKGLKRLDVCLAGQVGFGADENVCNVDLQEKVREAWDPGLGTDSVEFRVLVSGRLTFKLTVPSKSRGVWKGKPSRLGHLPCGPG